MNVQLQNLKAFALSNYDKGGHWVYETYEDADYEAALKEGFKKAKASLKAHWELMNEQESNAAWGGPDASPY